MTQEDLNADGRGISNVPWKPKVIDQLVPLTEVKKMLAALTVERDAEAKRAREAERELLNIKSELNQYKTQTVNVVAFHRMEDELAANDAEIKQLSGYLDKWSVNKYQDEIAALKAENARLTALTREPIVEAIKPFKAAWEARIATLEAALQPVAEEIRNSGNEYTESDWNHHAHIEKPITLTVKEARAILSALKRAGSGGL